MPRPPARFNCPKCGTPAPFYSSTETRLHITRRRQCPEYMMCGYRFITRQPLGSKIETFHADAGRSDGLDEAKKELILDNFYSLWTPANWHKYRSQAQRKAFLTAYRRAAKRCGLSLSNGEF